MWECNCGMKVNLIKDERAPRGGGPPAGEGRLHSQLALRLHVSNPSRRTPIPAGDEATANVTQRCCKLHFLPFRIPTFKALEHGFLQPKAAGEKRSVRAEVEGCEPVGSLW